MKKVFTLVAICICLSQLFAQDKLSASLGIALPTGDFSDVSSGGGAKTGFVLQLMYHRRIQGNFKLVSALRFQSNGINVTKFNLGLQNDMSATSWKALSLLLGPAMQLNLSDQIAIEPRMMMGYSRVSSPKITMYDAVGTPIMLIESVNAGALATLLGVNFNFKTSDKIEIVVGADYIISDPKFKLKASYGGNMYSYIDTYQRTDTFSITGGINFKLR